MSQISHFFKGRNVLVTGHTGFKGSWLTLWLNRLGAQVTGISLEPEQKPNLFTLGKIESLCEHHICDIRDTERFSELVHSAQPEIVFHLAAQPLVRASYREPVETIATNVMGTTNLLEALRHIDTVKSVVMITTDKVYQNREWVYPYREQDHLGGHDLYSASKAASEIIISGYRESFLSSKGVAIATARAGNVIGGGDWSEDRLIPDAIKAWQQNKPLEIRRPNSIRPWQHVLEPLLGYMQLAQNLTEDIALSGAFNFGPHTHQAATVREVINTAKSFYGEGEVIWHEILEGPHEAGLLALDTAKSSSALGVTPRWSLDETLHKTIDWYRAVAQGGDVRELCEHDIDAYEALL